MTDARIRGGSEIPRSVTVDRPLIAPEPVVVPPPDSITASAIPVAPGAVDAPVAVLSPPSVRGSSAIAPAPDALRASGPDAALLQRVEAELSAYRASGRIDVPPSLLQGIGEVQALQESLRTQIASATGDERAALQRRLATLDPAIPARATRALDGGYVRIPLDASLRAALLAQLEAGTPPPSTVPSTLRAPAPRVFLDAVQAAERGESRPSTVSTELWGWVEALQRTGIGSADVRAFLATGQLPTRFSTTDAVLADGEARTTTLLRSAGQGEWTAVNALTFLLNLRVSAARAERGQLEARLRGFPEGSAERTQLNATITSLKELDAATGRDLTSIFRVASDARTRGFIAEVRGFDTELRNAEKLRARGRTQEAASAERRIIAQLDQTLVRLTEEAQYAARYYPRNAGSLELTNAIANYNSARIELRHIGERTSTNFASVLAHITRGQRAEEGAGRAGVARSRILELESTRLDLTASRYRLYADSLIRDQPERAAATPAIREAIRGEAQAWHDSIGVYTERLRLLGGISGTDEQQLAAYLLAGRGRAETNLARNLQLAAIPYTPGVRPGVTLATVEETARVVNQYTFQDTTRHTTDLLAAGDRDFAGAIGQWSAASLVLPPSSVLADTGLQLASDVLANNQVRALAGQFGDTMPETLRQFPVLSAGLDRQRLALTVGSQQRTALASMQGRAQAGAASYVASFDPQASLAMLNGATGIARSDLTGEARGQLLGDIAVGGFGSWVNASRRAEYFRRSGLNAGQTATALNGLYGIAGTLASAETPQTREVVAAREQMGLTSGAFALVAADEVPHLLAGTLGVSTSQLTTQLTGAGSERLDTQGEQVGWLRSIFVTDTEVRPLDDAQVRTVVQQLTSRSPSEQTAALSLLTQMGANAAQEVNGASRTRVAAQILGAFASARPDYASGNPTFGVQVALRDASYQTQIGNVPAARTAYARAREQAAALTNPDERRGYEFATRLAEAQVVSALIAKPGASPEERRTHANAIRALREEGKRLGLAPAGMAQLLLLEAHSMLSAGQATEANTTLGELATYTNVPWVEKTIREFRARNTDGTAVAALQVFLREATSESPGEALAYTGGGAIAGAVLGSVGGPPGAALGALIGASLGTGALIVRNTVRGAPNIADAITSPGVNNNITAGESALQGGVLFTNIAFAGAPGRGASLLGREGLQMLLDPATDAVARRALGGVFYNGTAGFAQRTLLAAGGALIGAPYAQSIYTIENSNLSPEARAAAYDQMRDDLGASLPYIGGFVLGGGLIALGGRAFSPLTRSGGTGVAVREAAPEVTPRATVADVTPRATIPALVADAVPPVAVRAPALSETPAVAQVAFSPAIQRVVIGVDNQLATVTTAADALATVSREWRTLPDGDPRKAAAAERVEVAAERYARETAAYELRRKGALELAARTQPAALDALRARIGVPNPEMLANANATGNGVNGPRPTSIRSAADPRMATLVDFFATFRAAETIGIPARNLAPGVTGVSPRVLQAASELVRGRFASFDPNATNIAHLGSVFRENILDVFAARFKRERVPGQSVDQFVEETRITQENFDETFLETVVTDLRGKIGNAAELDSAMTAYGLSVGELRGTLGSNVIDRILHPSPEVQARARDLAAGRESTPLSPELEDQAIVLKNSILRDGREIANAPFQAGTMFHGLLEPTQVIASMRSAGMSNAQISRGVIAMYAHHATHYPVLGMAAGDLHAPDFGVAVREGVLTADEGQMLANLYREAFAFYGKWAPRYGASELSPAQWNEMLRDGNGLREAVSALPDYARRQLINDDVGQFTPDGFPKWTGLMTAIHRPVTNADLQRALAVQAIQPYLFSNIAREYPSFDIARRTLLDTGRDRFATHIQNMSRVTGYHIDSATLTMRPLEPGSSPYITRAWTIVNDPQLRAAFSNGDTAVSARDVFIRHTPEEITRWFEAQPRDPLALDRLARDDRAIYSDLLELRLGIRDSVQ